MPSAIHPLPEGVRIERDPHGLDRLVIDTAAASGVLYLQGAHVTHWQPAGQRPVLWMSQRSWFEPGKPLRGGVPVCFPWFGPRQQPVPPGKLEPTATPVSYPAHGFARLRPWDLGEVSAAPDGTVAVTLHLLPDDDTRRLWPHAFALSLRASFGRSLGVTLDVHHRSDTAFTFERALHTYLAVGDVRRVAIHGLSGVAYLDKVGTPTRRTQPDGPIRITGETDRVYLDTDADCVVDDPAMRRRIVVGKRGSRSTVVWNPWIAKAAAMPDFGDDEWPGMLCIETADAADNAVTLAPGQGSAMTATLNVESDD